MSKLSIGGVKVVEYQNLESREREDLLVTEEPLEIRLGFGESYKRKEIQLAVTMRTPGNDLDLACGFIYSEGIIDSHQQILKAVHCENVKPEEKGNVVRVELIPGFTPDIDGLQRNFYMTSSCGVCGKSSIEAIDVKCNPLSNETRIRVSQLYEMLVALESKQRIFEHTGGLHAGGLFSTAGELLLMREDVGRHNAVDKIVGAALRSSMIPLTAHVLLLSGRGGFELIQKAIRSGIAIVAAVGAPSSLSVKLAESFDLGLAGFLKGNRFNVYSGKDRFVV